MKIMNIYKDFFIFNFFLFFFYCCCCPNIKNNVYNSSSLNKKTEILELESFSTPKVINTYKKYLNKLIEHYSNLKEYTAYFKGQNKDNTKNTTSTKNKQQKYRDDQFLNKKMENFLMELLKIKIKNSDLINLICSKYKNLYKKLPTKEEYLNLEKIDDKGKEKIKEEETEVEKQIKELYDDFKKNCKIVINGCIFSIELKNNINDEGINKIPLKTGNGTFYEKYKSKNFDIIFNDVQRTVPLKTENNIITIQKKDKDNENNENEIFNHMDRDEISQIILIVLIVFYTFRDVEYIQGFNFIAYFFVVLVFSSEDKEIIAKEKEDKIFLTIKLFTFFMLICHDLLEKNEKKLQKVVYYSDIVNQLNFEENNEINCIKDLEIKFLNKIITILLYKFCYKNYCISYDFSDSFFITFFVTLASYFTFFGFFDCENFPITKNIIFLILLINDLGIYIDFLCIFCKLYLKNFNIDLDEKDFIIKKDEKSSTEETLFKVENMKIFYNNFLNCQKNKNKI